MSHPHRLTAPRPRGAVPTALALGVLWGAACGALAQGGPAGAEASPYSVGAGLGLEHDDNLFRAPQGQAQADTQTVARLFGDLDQRWGRHRLQGHADLHDHRYRSRQELNNLGYNARLGWEGSTEGEVSWNLSHETDRRLASYGTVQDPAFRGSNIATVDETLAGAQLGLQALWVARLALGHRRVQHTAQAFEREQLSQDSVGASLQWNPLGPLGASIGPRTTRGHVPLASDGVRRSFRRDDLDFGLQWMATGESELHARLSLTRQRYDAPEQGDFNGATGQLDWQWVLTGRTRLKAVLSRETGSQAAIFGLSEGAQTVQASGDNSQLTTALGLHIDHDLTGKILLGLDLQTARRELGADIRQADGSLLRATGSDRSALIRLGLRYAPTRSTALACSLGHERRSASTPLSSAYRANTVGCEAQLTLRWS